MVHTGTEAGDLAPGRALNPVYLWDHADRVWPALKGVIVSFTDVHRWLLIGPIAISLSVSLFARERRRELLAPLALVLTGCAFLVWVDRADTLPEAARLGESVDRVVAPLAMLSAMSIFLSAEWLLRSVVARRQREDSAPDVGAGLVAPEAAAGTTGSFGRALARARSPSAASGGLQRSRRDRAASPDSELTMLGSVASAVGARADLRHAWAALTLGGLIALTGFPPLVNVPARLNVTSDIPLIALTPTAVAVYAAYWAARRTTARPSVSVPKGVAVGIALLLAGATLSLLGSSNPRYSLCLALLALVLPTALFFWLRRADLSSSLVIGGFFVAVSAALVRADFTFLREYGIPTSQVIYRAKFTQQAYDFHYYTLGNPTHTATFLVLPLGAAVYWASHSATSRPTRRWLLAFIALLLFNLVLLYERFPLLVAALLVIAAFVRGAIPRVMKTSIAVGAIAAIGVLVLTSPSHYFSDLFSLSAFHNGGPPGNGPSSARVRLDSVAHGFTAFVHHPLTGVGLGEFGTAPNTTPAHVAIVNAAADMGILGGAGLALLTALGAVSVWRSLRSHPAPLHGAGAYACGSYLMVAAVSGGAIDGVLVGTVSVYGLALAMFAAVACPAVTPVRARWRALRLPMPDFVPRRAPPRSTRVRKSAISALRQGVCQAPRRTAYAATAGFVVGALVLVGIIARLGGTKNSTRRSTVAIPAAAGPSSPIAPPSERYTPVLSSSRFRAFPPGWSLMSAQVNGTVARAATVGNTLTVWTSAGHASYQLLGPVLLLRRGRYIAVINGTVERGGLDLGVLNVARGTWIAQAVFPIPQPKPVSMPVSFRLNQPTRVQVILCNFRNRDLSSIWSLSQALIAGPAAVDAGNSSTTQP